MPTADEHFAQIRTGLGYLLCAVGWAVALVTTLQACLGGTQYESPLLYTLLAVNTATMAVGVITAGVSATGYSLQPELVRETAAASYVFANAASTLAALVGHFAETLETGWKDRAIDSHDGLTIILDLLVLSQNDYFIVYLCATAVFALLTLPLVFWSAHLVVGERVASNTELAFVGVCSLVLLVVGLLIGTPWAPVTADTREAMTFYAWLLRIAALILITLGFAIYGFLSFLSVTRLGLVFSFGALRFGQKFGGDNALTVLGRIAKEVWYGFLIGLAGLFVIGLLWLLGTPLVLSLPFLSISFRERFAESFAHGFYNALIFTFWSFVGALFILAFRLWGKAVAKSVWQLFVLAGVSAYNFFKLIGFIFVFVLSALAEAVMLAVRFVRWLLQSRSKQTPEDKASERGAGWFGGVWRLGTPRFGWPSMDLAAILKLLLVAAAMWGLVAVAGVAIDWFNKPRPIVATDGDKPKPPPGFEFASPEAILMCEALPGGYDWAKAQVDRLEIALDDCALPSRVLAEKDGVLVVVSVASFSDNKAREIDLAWRRAQALSAWSARRTPSGMPIYVLHLGMANSTDAFGVGWSKFGIVRGVRPVLGLLLTPYPDGTTVPVATILEELQRGLLYARVSDSFSNCELYRFDGTAQLASQLARVDDFSCEAK